MPLAVHFARPGVVLKYSADAADGSTIAGGEGAVMAVAALIVATDGPRVIAENVSTPKSQLSRLALSIWGKHFLTVLIHP